MAGRAESQEPAGDVPTAGGEVGRDGQPPGAETAPVPGEGAEGEVRISGGGLPERREIDSGGRPRGGHIPRLHPTEMTSRFCLNVVLLNQLFYSVVLTVASYSCTMDNTLA